MGDKMTKKEELRRYAETMVKKKAAGFKRPGCGPAAKKTVSGDKGDHSDSL